MDNLSYVQSCTLYNTAAISQLQDLLHSEDLHQNDYPRRIVGVFCSSDKQLMNPEESIYRKER